MNPIDLDGDESLESSTPLHWDSLSAFFPSNHATGNIQRSYSENDIREITSLLARLDDGVWSRTPRLYIVLRRANLLELHGHFASLRITDSSFPFSGSTLPKTLGLTHRSSFLQIQSCVMTEEAKLGDCEKGRHIIFQRPDQVPFQNKGILGSGGFAQVDRVMSTITNKQYARKIFHKNKFGRFKDSLADFENELEILKQMKHEHIVEIVGSYTDPRYMALIMSPVADCDLSRFLRTAPGSRDGISSLRTFFGCLATAVAYLHKNKIRHKDIKPSNVLVKDGNVLLTDFGLSRDCNHTRSTTEGPTARTAKYCAPEVADYMPRSYSSDMFSLGCVFLEMLTVLKGHSLDEMSTFLSENGSHATQYPMNLAGVKSWMENLEVSQAQEGENGPLSWIEQLMSEDKILRPEAYMLTSEIAGYRSDSDKIGEFCGICCRIEDDVGSVDSEGLFVEDDDSAVVVKASVEDEDGMWIDSPTNAIRDEVPGRLSD